MKCFSFGHTNCVSHLNEKRCSNWSSLKNGWWHMVWCGEIHSPNTKCVVIKCTKMVFGHFSHALFLFSSLLLPSSFIPSYSVISMCEIRIHGCQGFMTSWSGFIFVKERHLVCQCVCSICVFPIWQSLTHWRHSLHIKCVFRKMTKWKWACNKRLLFQCQYIKTDPDLFHASICSLREIFTFPLNWSVVYNNVRFIKLCRCVSHLSKQ